MEDIDLFSFIRYLGHIVDLLNRGKTLEDAIVIVRDSLPNSSPPFEEALRKKLGQSLGDCLTLQQIFSSGRATLYSNIVRKRSKQWIQDAKGYEETWVMTYREEIRSQYREELHSRERERHEQGR